MTNKEKSERYTITARPSTIAKAIELSEKLLGKENLSGIIDHLIFKEHNIQFSKEQKK